MQQLWKRPDASAVVFTKSKDVLLLRLTAITKHNRENESVVVKCWVAKPSTPVCVRVCACVSGKSWSTLCAAQPPSWLTLQSTHTHHSPLLWTNTAVSSVMDAQSKCHHCFYPPKKFCSRTNAPTLASLFCLPLCSIFAPVPFVSSARTVFFFSPYVVVLSDCFVSSCVCVWRDNPEIIPPLTAATCQDVSLFWSVWVLMSTSCELDFIMACMMQHCRQEYILPAVSDMELSVCSLWSEAVWNKRPGLTAEGSVANTL